MTRRMIPDEPTTPESPLQAWRGRLLKAGITLLTVFLVWYFVSRSDIEWADLAARVAEASPLLLTIGMLLLLARFWLWDWRFRLAARRAVGRSSGAVLGFFVLLASACLNLVTPAVRLAGGLLRARYWARWTGRSFGFFYGVVLYDQVAHHVTMTACTWITLIAAAYALGKPWLGTAALAALLGVALWLALWTRRKRSSEAHPVVGYLARRAERAEGKLQRLFAHGHEAVGVFVRLLSHVPLRPQVAALGASYFLVNAGAQWMMFLAMGLPVDPLVVIAVVALGNAVGTLSGTPGGLGTTELTMVASFEAMGVDEVAAAAGTLLFRGLHYAAVLGIGLPALALLEMRRGEGGEAPPESTSL
jgi:uncharacterized protein (TIRG00374 family)